MSDEKIQPRRNFLFVPGTRPDRFPKALAAGPDMVTVDLEDAVIPPQKDEARALTMPLFDGTADRIERVVRINGMRTAFGLRDLLAIIEHPTPPDGIMLPKVESADEVRIVAALLERAARRVNLHVIIESNPGLDRVQAIAGASPSGQVAAVRGGRHGGRTGLGHGLHLDALCPEPGRARGREPWP